MQDRQDKLANTQRSADRGFHGRTLQSPKARGAAKGPQQSRYFTVHAFNRKRTLASGFFNDKQVTRANNKQFASGLRSPAKAAKKNEQTRGPGAADHILNTTRSQLPKAPRPGLGGKGPSQAALGQASSGSPAPRLHASQDSLVSPRGLQAVASAEHSSQGPQDGIGRGTRTKNFPFSDNEQVQANQQAQNVSMSVMSLKGVPGQPAPALNFRIAQQGFDPNQYASPPKSLAGKEAAIQNVTITQRLHGPSPSKHLGMTGMTQPAPGLPGQPNQVGAAGPQMGAARARASRLAVDQKLDRLARQSAAQDSDSTSRFVTFQGEQIGVLKMSLGPDDVSSKNVTFYGGTFAGQPQQHHGKVSRNSSLSPQGHHQALKFPGQIDGTRNSKPGPLAGQGKPRDAQGNLIQLNVEAARARDHVAAQGGEAKGGKAPNDTYQSRDFEELNKLIEDGTGPAEMRDGQFGRLGEVREGNASQKHLSKQGVADYQRKSIGDAKSSLKPFGRRGTQRLDDESLIGLRVGSGILAGEDQAEGSGPGAGIAKAGKQGEKFPESNTAKPAYGSPDRKLQGQDSPPASHAGTLMGKSQKNSQVLAVEAGGGRANAQAVGMPPDAAMEAAIIDLSRSTERTRTADRSYQKGQGHSHLQLSMAQNAEALNAGVQAFRAANSVNSTESKAKILAGDEVPNKSMANRKTGLRDGSGGPTLMNAQGGVQVPTAVMEEGAVLHTGADGQAEGVQEASNARILQLSPESSRVVNSGALLNASLIQQYGGSSGEQTIKKRAGEEGQVDGRHARFPSGVNVGLSPLPGDPQFQSSPAGSRLMSDGTMSGATGLLARASGDAQAAQAGQDDYNQNPDGRMAVAIGHRDGMPPGTFHDDRDRPPPGDKAATEKPAAPEADADPEQVILMRILEKMLLRHKLTGMPQRSEYTKFRPRQWETIEDKLCTLDVRAEVVEEDRKGLKKDYVKQIQDHIKEIIKTGKDAKIGTQAAQLEHEQKKNGQRARIGVKLQQLRTTWNSFTAAKNLAGNSVGFDTTLVEGEPIYHNFNDLRSQSNLHHEASRQMLDAKGNPMSPYPEYSADEFATDRQPRHSRSVAPHQMLLPSPQAQYTAAGLQPVNSQNLMFQSNRDIQLLPKGLKGNASNNLIGARAQLSSVSFALPLSSSPQGLVAIDKRDLVTKNSETDVKQRLGQDDKLVTDRPRQTNMALRAHTTELDVIAPKMPVATIGLTGEQPFLGDTMQSFMSKDDQTMHITSSNMLGAERALQSTQEYHSQYNRLDDVIKFKLPVVKKSHLYHPGRGDNERLNEIHAKLRDPAGHLQLMERNAIVQNKHKSSLTGVDPGSFATISRPGLSCFRDSVQSLEPVRRASLLNERVKHEQSAYSTQFLSLQSPRQGQAPPNLLATITQQSRSLMPSAGRLNMTDNYSHHPIEEQYAKMKEKQEKRKPLDQWSDQGQLPKPRDLDKRPKISEWLSKEVMLPILGKNKTSLLHSKDQLEIESIAQQTSCINKPFERLHASTSKAQATGPTKGGIQFGFLSRTGAQGKAGAGGGAGGPKKLSALLKQQEKEMADQEKAQERHLLRQIEKVARLMVDTQRSKVVSASSKTEGSQVANGGDTEAVAALE